MYTFPSDASVHDKAAVKKHIQILTRIPTVIKYWVMMVLI
jgi:hypothetical protein